MLKNKPAHYMYENSGLSENKSYIRQQHYEMTTRITPCPLYRMMGITLIVLGICTFGYADMTPPEEIVETGYFSLKKMGECITSLRFDASGEGNYGMETIAAGGALYPVKTVEYVRNVINITSTNETLRWEMPFMLDGYYDADAHLNYPDTRSTSHAEPLILPFRSFVGSSGQVVRIEHFKRLFEGNVILWLNIENGHRLLMQSDDTQNWDIDVLWPGCTRIDYAAYPEQLTFANAPDAAGNNALTAPMRIEVTHRGSREVPLSMFTQPSCTFSPDFDITYAPTGKTISASRLMTEFMRHGIYWAPLVNLRGEWVSGAVETHMFNDPRTYYSQQLRHKLLEYLGFIGYDRFEHFGHIYMWGRYPDYGAGYWLNKPPDNAPHDKRMLHINGMWIHSIMQYVLATRDVDFLRSRRSRWLATNGAEPQPLCGADADIVDFVLTAGDARLDGRQPIKRHSLGQSFTATAPFSEVQARIGNPAGWLGVNDLQGAGPPIVEPNHGQLTLYDQYGGTVIAKTSFSLEPDTFEDVTVHIPYQLEPGVYYLELTDDAGGERYFSPGITWATEMDSTYKGGDAYSGPFHGDVSDALRLLFNYMREHMGAVESDMTYYQDDREYNVPDQKSGRNHIGQAHSFWEGAGNAYDSYQSLWYPAACTAMAEMAELLGENEEAASYRELRKRADEAYNDFFWYTLLENGRTVSRYFHCQDWDGVRRDYGYVYNNLEAAVRGIAGHERSRDILWWLDRGQYSPDGGNTWLDDMYSIWELAPPYNTIENLDYLPVSNTLPYRQVVSNGGSRPMIAARDLALRTTYLSIDNMHERNKQVLARYASPDRLTGGRVYSHWIGRWQFLGPPDDILDFEGFRDIFPQDGCIASLQPSFYFRFDLSAQGLRMQPRLPAELDAIRFDGITYGGTVLDFEAKSLRDNIAVQSENREAPYAITFRAEKPFNKAGVCIHFAHSTEHTKAQVSLTLEQQVQNTWHPIAETWYNHVQDEDWIWIDADKRLPVSSAYRIRLHDISLTDRGEIAGLDNQEGKPVLQLIDESTQVTVMSRYNPTDKTLKLLNKAGEIISEGNQVSATIGPDEYLILCND